MNFLLTPGESLIIRKSSGENITTLKFPNNSPIFEALILFILIAFFPSLSILISIVLSNLSLPTKILTKALSAFQLINSLSLEVLWDLANAQ